VETIDHGNFLRSTSGRLTAVDFWAPWCGPCRAFAPVFEEVAGRFGDQVAFGTCNVDDNGPVAALLQIQSIPTVVLFGADGSEIDRISGFLNRRQLERLVAGALEQANP
jgi:thioredoxin 1